MARPPREGARWGEDPAVPTPSVPEPYLRLSAQYGEPNVQAALAIVETCRTDFPSLPLLRQDDIAVAAEILDFAQRSQAAAAADGRVHSMPATLKRVGQDLGHSLARRPEIQTLESLSISFGDEENGFAAKAARAAQAAAEEEKTGAKVLVVLGATAIAFVWAWNATGSFWWGLSAAGGAFFFVGKLLLD